MAQSGFRHSEVQRMKSSENAANDSETKKVGQTPIISPDLESGATLEFRPRIVRDSDLRAGKLLTDQSPDYASIGKIRPLSLPDVESSRQKGGMFQASRDARAVCLYLEAKARNRSLIKETDSTSKIPEMTTIISRE